ncbi:MAG: riboflavin biosynthesis protein RibF [Coprobacter sp.]|nr:riboflavin biosynthesis protein RibF [Coprobacter sp.]
MQIIERIDRIPAGSLVAGIGFFDGVHAGHRKLIGEIVGMARTRNLSSGVITFRRHPRQVLHTDYCPHLITSFEERMQCLSATGLDYCVVLDFTPELSRMSAEAFISLLSRHYGVSCLFIGYDHRFGHNRAEGFDDYVRYGRELGLDVVPAEGLLSDGKPVSSSVVRALLQQGKVGKAATLLTVPYRFEGIVVEGHRLGCRLGFPTANLRLTDPDKIVPANGVYAVRVELPDGICRNGMLNIGVRPTVKNGRNRSIEVHIFDYSGDLYGCRISVSFVSFLREERQLSGVEELTLQLQKDKEHALSILL